jgi:hypothetical protein
MNYRRHLGTVHKQSHESNAYTRRHDDARDRLGEPAKNEMGNQTDNQIPRGATIVKAFHFLRADRTSDCGNESPWEDGETRIIADPEKIILCEYGYHSSPTLWDALNYAPGPLACLVEISEPIETDGEAGRAKAVSASRQLIKAVNIDRELRLFACDCAERVLHIYERDNSSKAPRQAIEVARRFANGKATNEELAAAREAAGAARAAARAAVREAAAWAAAWAAAAGAARAAVREAAAWAAAREAAAGAARAAAWAAAAGAAWAAAREAEIKWQREHFDQMFGGIFS